MRKHDITEILTWIYFVPFSVIIFLILGAGLFTTIYYDLYQEADLPRFGKENIPLLLICTCAVLLLLTWMRNRTGLISELPVRKIVQGRMYPMSRMMRTALIWCAAVSLYLILIVRGLATNDALQLDKIINAFMQGDYSSVTGQGGYLFVYPFQIGYVAAGQLLYVLFGASNYLVYQLLNLIAILITIWMLYQITWEIFEDRVICNIMAALSMGMLFLFVYSTFVYGDIWSLAPEMTAIYLELRFLKYEKLPDQIWAAVLMGCAVVLKTNCYIAVVAMAIMLLLDLLKVMTGEHQAEKHMLRKKALIRVMLVLLLILMSKGMTGIINTAYAKAIGIDAMPEGVPSTTYFAMAMQEGETENGWYNGFNVNTYRAAGYDRNKANEMAADSIKIRLQEFADRPLHAVRFYTEKLLSQWADPTCISMRELELTSRHVEGQPAIMYSIVYGKGRIVFQWIMNVFQFLIYLGTAVYVADVYRKRKLGFNEAFLILFVFGGMLFHELWEGSSRYTMRYYICLLPFAAYGIRKICDKIGVSVFKKQ